MDTIQDITLDTINQFPVIIIEGIAGSAKTSTVVKVLQDANIEYLHTTSTNKLKRDIEARFHHNAKTVASALFRTENGSFYKSERRVEEQYIVIDEILQTDSRIYTWIDHNKSKDRHIIICTDSRQMLSPINGERMLYGLQNIENNEKAIHLSKTYRPINSRTEELYNYLYNAPSEKYDVFAKISHLFEKIQYNPDAEYNSEDVYLCHTNTIEKQLYKNWDLYNDYENVNILPKGTLANRFTGTVRKTYPILPQKDIGNLEDYYQIGNIGSVVRYQGSEVNPGHTLYFLVNKGSRVYNRELYTMVTRAKDYNDIKIVVVPEEPKTSITLDTFYGKEIRSGRFLKLNTEEKTMPKEDITKLINAANQKDREENEDANVVYNEVVNSNGEIIKSSENQDKSEIPGIIKYLKKEPNAKFEQTEDIYYAIEQLRKKHPVFDGIRTMRSYNIGVPKRREMFQYEIDLYSAYPNIWKRYKILDGSTFSLDRGGQIDLYILITEEIGIYGDIVTGEFLQYMNEHGENLEAEFLGSCDILKSDTIGDKLSELAYKDIESKAKLKKMYYGYMQKPYLESFFIKDDEDNEEEVFVKVPSRKYEIQMAYIQSQLALVMAKIRTVVVGDCHNGYAKVDALFFNGYNEHMIDELKEAISGYDYRIKKHDWKKGTEEIIYQTYKDLKHRSHQKKKQ